MNKLFNKRDIPIYKSNYFDLEKSCWNFLGFTKSRRLGKYQKKAQMLLCYGAGDKMVTSKSGFSLRRVKVLRKKLIQPFFLKSLEEFVHKNIEKIRPLTINPTGRLSYV